LPAHDRTSALERLADIAAPTLVIVGARDFPEIVELSRTVAGAVPGAALEVMKGIAHLPQLEAPERLMPLIVDFLETI
jgi:pimeloyl-ACP methyl ester carboxylesterase